MLNHVRVPELIRTVTASQDLSLGALNYTTSIDLPFQLEQILVHSDTGITEVFNATFDSENGANYDVKLGAMDFDGLQDIALVGGENLVRALCSQVDQIRLTTDGNASSGTIYITIKYKLKLQ